MDQNPNQNTSLFQLNLDAQNSYTLRSAATWSRVLGIIGLIIGALCILFGIVIQQKISQYGGYYRTNGVSSQMMGNAGLVGYVLVGLMYIVSSIFALNAGNKILRGLKTNDQQSLNTGFAAIRNYFAFWTILMILFLLLLLIGFLGSLGS
jgi:hypothetical protein